MVVNDRDEEEEEGDVLAIAASSIEICPRHTQRSRHPFDTVVGAAGGEVREAPPGTGPTPRHLRHAEGEDEDDWLGRR